MGYAAMTFWLYSEAVMKPADIEAVLTDWGKCQWELVAFLPAQEKGSDQYRAIFKRPDDSNDGPEEERDFVHNEIKGLRESLLTAFQMIRQQTALVCDLSRRNMGTCLWARLIGNARTSLPKNKIR